MRPPTSTRPDVGLMIPETRRSSVVLPGAVAADEPDGLPGLDRERDVAQRPHVAGSAAAARDEHVLQRALRLRVDAERARDAVDDDAARTGRRHVATAATA